MAITFQNPALGWDAFGKGTVHAVVVGQLVTAQTPQKTNNLVLPQMELALTSYARIFYDSTKF